MKLILILVTALLVAGCGPSVGDLPEETTELVPVGGTVTLDGQPLANAIVRFMPASGAAGMAYFGSTDLTGQFSLRSPRGRSGAEPGSYVVVISKFARADGIPFASDADPGDVAAEGVEHVPAKYSDGEQSQLRATVPQEGKTDFEFPLTR